MKKSLSKKAKKVIEEGVHIFCTFMGFIAVY